MKKICKECNEGFKADVKTRLFCSRKCYGRWRSKNIRGITYIEKNCPVCSKDFLKPLSQKAHKYCSMHCFILKMKERVGDKNPFFGRKHPNPKGGMSGKKHTDEAKQKMSKARKGRKFTEEHKQNLSMSLRKTLIDFNSFKRKEKQRIRKSMEYRTWRESVFKRDNWTCQKCNIRSGNGKTVYLEAHHLKSFTHYPDLRFEVSNGETLCKECHKIENKKQMQGNKNGVKRK